MPEHAREGRREGQGADCDDGSRRTDGPDFAGYHGQRKAGHSGGEQRERDGLAGRPRELGQGRYGRAPHVWAVGAVPHQEWNDLQHHPGDGEGGPASQGQHRVGEAEAGPGHHLEREAETQDDGRSQKQRPDEHQA